MILRRLPSVIGLASLIASGAYVFVYLYRWEWNRALTAGLFFLAAEIVLVAAYLGQRLRRLEERVDRASAADPARERIQERISASASPARDHFAWLRSSAGRTSVFIPVLMGAGVILSVVAWAVERLARMTARPAMDGALARRLMPISVPPGPIVRDDATALAPDGVSLLRRPGSA